jgi:hypothetical protein
LQRMGAAHHESGYHSKPGATESGEDESRDVLYPREGAIRLLSALPVPMRRHVKDSAIAHNVYCIKVWGSPLSAAAMKAGEARG